jgi:hypothetical protein
MGDREPGHVVKNTPSLSKESTKLDAIQSFSWATPTLTNHRTAQSIMAIDPIACLLYDVMLQRVTSVFSAK